MRMPALLTAAILAAVPVAAAAEGPPVRIVGEPVASEGQLQLHVWVAYGYGKQILNDHGWADVFETNHENAAKVEGDVVVRFDSDTCTDGEAWLVGQLSAWFGSHPDTRPTFFHKIEDGDAGWLWDVAIAVDDCTCGTLTTVVYHCANGVVHTTCNTDDGYCGPTGVVTVQAFNRPKNEKCETDLTGDGEAECDFAELPGGNSWAVEFTPSHAWSFDPATGCTEAQYAAGTCEAACHASSPNGPTTTITCGYGGVQSIDFGTCNNTCEAIAETTVCVHPSDNDDHGNPNNPGNGNPPGGNPHGPQLQQTAPARVAAPALKAVKQQPARFDPTKRPRTPVR